MALRAASGVQIGNLADVAGGERATTFVWAKVAKTIARGMTVSALPRARGTRTEGDLDAEEVGGA